MYDLLNHGVSKSGRFDKASKKSGEVLSGVPSVSLVTTLCEGQGKAGKSVAQVYENGTGIEGLGV